MPGKVKSIEYDPSRSAFIALIFYADGEKRYILAPNDIKIDAEIILSKNKVPLKPGNRTYLENIPLGKREEKGGWELGQPFAVKQCIPMLILMVAVKAALL